VDFAVNLSHDVRRMDHKADLLTIAHAFGTATNRSLARVSTMVRNDGKFFDRLERGAGCTMATYEACMQWFADNWPEDAEWPTGVTRRPAKPKPQPIQREAAAS
jgi:hypothetical protein